jgi:hypothetical protein
MTVTDEGVTTDLSDEELKNANAPRLESLILGPIPSFTKAGSSETQTRSSSARSLEMQTSVSGSKYSAIEVPSQSITKSPQTRKK